MKKLEDIPKKQIFEVPDGYFEKLPGIIQSRVSRQQEQKSIWSTYSYSLRYALPAVIIITVGILWYSQTKMQVSAENMLTSIHTQDLIAYLNEADFTTEELLDAVELDGEDVTRIEEEVFEFELSDSDFKEFFDDID